LFIVILILVVMAQMYKRKAGNQRISDFFMEETISIIVCSLLIRQR